MTDIIAKGPRMLMSFDGSFIKVQNNDGSVTIRDTQKDTSYRMKDGLVINVDQPCPHENTRPYMIDPSGECLTICLDCGEVY